MVYVTFGLCEYTENSRRGVIKYCIQNVKTLVMYVYVTWIVITYIKTVHKSIKKGIGEFTDVL